LKTDNNITSVGGKNIHSFHLNPASKQSTTFGQWQGLNLVDFKLTKFVFTDVKSNLETRKSSKADWLGHILRGNCLINQVIEVKKKNNRSDGKTMEQK
jgi:hypothetical protein